jgi:hypothetical protein
MPDGRVRVAILLPLPASVAAKIMLAIGGQYPDAVVAEPTAQETAQHGDLMVIEVKQ